MGIKNLNTKKTILVTGGCGFIGSHFISILDPEKYKVLVIDNLSNSKETVLDKVKKINPIDIAFYQHDLRNYHAVKNLIATENIKSIVHFAGLKAVAESVKLPLDYYENNLMSTINLLKIVEKYNIESFIFSSSATVYGDSKVQPVDESLPLSSMNAYASTKIMCEQIITHASELHRETAFFNLRYFNPIGAHPSGLIGEDPLGIPNNLMPFILKVAQKKEKYLSIFGNDYPTKDGTGIRDFIHVMDLVEGHLAALNYGQDNSGLYTFNLGTGIATSVLDLVYTFEKVNKVNIPFEIIKRRVGDVAVSFAAVESINKKLNWYAHRDIGEMCRDAWSWIKNAPH